MIKAARVFLFVFSCFFTPDLMPAAHAHASDHKESVIYPALRKARAKILHEALLTYVGTDSIVADIKGTYKKKTSENTWVEVEMTPLEFLKNEIEKAVTNDKKTARVRSYALQRLLPVLEHPLLKEPLKTADDVRVVMLAYGRLNQGPECQAIKLNSFGNSVIHSALAAARFSAIRKALYYFVGKPVAVAFVKNGSGETPLEYLKRITAESLDDHKHKFAAGAELVLSHPELKVPLVSFDQLERILPENFSCAGGIRRALAKDEPKDPFIKGCDELESLLPFEDMMSLFGAPVSGEDFP